MRRTRKTRRRARSDRTPDRSRRRDGRRVAIGVVATVAVAFAIALLFAPSTWLFPSSRVRPPYIPPADRPLYRRVAGTYIDRREILGTYSLKNPVMVRRTESRLEIRSDGTFTLTDSGPGALGISGTYRTGGSAIDFTIGRKVIRGRLDEDAISAVFYPVARGRRFIRQSP